LKIFNGSVFIALADNVKKALVQQGYAEHLVNIVSSMKHEQKDEFLKQRVQSAADLIVMLLTEGQNYFIFSSALACCIM